MAAEELGVMAMLSFPLATDSSGVVGGLNLYAAEAHAFDEATLHTGMPFATYGALLFNATAARTKIVNLQPALETSRHMGVALGVLMSHYKVTRHQAFDVLNTTSQRLHRKLRDIAAGVAETGELPGSSTRVPTAPAPH
ncbi:MAG: ANTAR domain-containing protein [Sporichthyaceae bacterium]